MAIGEIGLVGLAVVSLVVEAQVVEQDNVITQVHPVAETTVLDRPLSPSTVTLICARVS